MTFELRKQRRCLLGQRSEGRTFWADGSAHAKALMRLKATWVSKEHRGPWPGRGGEIDLTRGLLCDFCSGKQRLCGAGYPHFARRKLERLRAGAVTCPGVTQQRQTPGPSTPGPKPMPIASEARGQGKGVSKVPNSPRLQLGPQGRGVTE